MKILLVGSLLLNALLLVGLALYHPTVMLPPPVSLPSAVAVQAEPAPAPAIETPAPAPAATAPVESLVGAWNDSNGDLAARLKAVGLPRNVIYAAMLGRNAKLRAERWMSIKYPNGFTRWSAASPPSREATLALNDMHAQARREIAEAMGPDFYTANSEVNPGRAIKWGDLAPAELAAVTSVTEKYDRLMVTTTPPIGGLDAASLAKDYAFNTAFENDIRAALGKGKGDDFLTYNSFEANVLQAVLAGVGISVDEGVYLDLLQARDDLHASFRDAIANGKDDIHARRLLEAQMYESILGPEQGIKVATADDPFYRQIDSLLEEAGQDIGSRVSIHANFLNTLSALQGLAAANANNLDAVKPQLAAIKARYYNELATRIPAPQLNKVMQTNSGAFLRAWSGGRGGP